MSKYFLIILFFTAAGQTLAITPIEDQLAMPTNGNALHLFLRNPAIIKTDKSVISVTHITNKREVEVTADPENSGNLLGSSIEEKYLAGGFLFPLGGAAAGLSMQKNMADLSGRIDVLNTPVKETFRDQRFAAHFVVDLTDSLRAAFAYRYMTIENDVAGNYFLNSSDRTNYKGTLSGYTIGFFHEINKLSWGLYHSPAMRGKAEIEGEQKIISDPGTAGLDATIRSSDQFTFGITINRWFYKRSDLAEPSTSPEDERRISLRGLDFEQFYYKTQSWELGFDYALKKEFLLRLGFVKQQGVFLFDGESVPGDNENRETVVDYNILKLIFSYTNKDFNIELGKHFAKREKNEIFDNNFGFFSGRYTDYKGGDDSLILALSFQR